MNQVSIVIKAYNEEAKIDAAIHSALNAATEFRQLDVGVEVVVADGLSTDGTAALATQWAPRAPVRVVQLKREVDRNCGAGVELGFQASRGQWVLFMDADMVLQPGFVGPALAFLQTHPECAGVAGVIEDAELRNGTDRIRQQQGLSRDAGPQPWLNGGGLYRRAALMDVGGYAGDSRLAAFEEADLGLRLSRAGWTLERIPVLAMRHYGHEQPTWVVMTRRWRSGRFEAAGRLLRLHGLKPMGLRAWRLFVHPLVLLMAWVWTVAWWVQPAVPQPLSLAVVGPALMATGAVVHAGLKRDLVHVATSWLDWHLLMLGIVKGLMQPMPERQRRLSCRVLADGVLTRHPPHPSMQDAA